MYNTIYEINKFEEQIEEKKAEVIVGVSKFKEIKQKDVLKLYDKFVKFVTETKTKYPNCDKFYLKVGKNTFFNGIDKIEKKDIIKDDKEIMGIVQEETKDYYSKYTLIGKTEIETEYKKVLELEKIRTILNGVEIREREITINNPQDKFKVIKGYLRVNDNYIKSYKYSVKDLQNFITDILEIDYKIRLEKQEEDKIFKVIEKENIRLALWKESGNNLYYIIAIPEFNLYNYLDEERFIETDYNTIVIFDYDVSKNDFEFFEEKNFKNSIIEEFKFMINDELQTLIRKDKIKENRENQQTNQKDNLNKKIGQLFKDNKEVTLHQIKRTKQGYFYFQNQKIGYKDYNVLEIDYEEKDFNNIFNRVVMSYLYNYKNPLSCGDFKINMKQKNNYWYIEGLRINQNEREDVLKRTICYTKKKEFLVFLKEVSKCSIKIHNVLSKGLVYNLNSNRYETKDKIFTNIKVTRKNGKQHINYKDKLYNISNTNALLNMSKWSYNTINTHILALNLEKYSALNYQTALLVIKDGLKEYKLSKKRAEELLKDTIKKLNIKVMNVENSEVTGKGYLVKGKSGQQYFIKDDLKIYRYPNMSYICVVDKGKFGNLNSMDLLVSRLFACRNDTSLNKEIHTLNK